MRQQTRQRPDLRSSTPVRTPKRSPAIYLASERPLAPLIAL
jgi:hypothetical protein